MKEKTMVEERTAIPYNTILCHSRTIFNTEFIRRYMNEMSTRSHSFIHSIGLRRRAEET